MLKGSHATILVNFDKNLGQNFVKLGQILVKIFKNQKATYFGSKNASFEIFKNLTHWTKFWCRPNSKILSDGSNFSKFQSKHFWTQNMSLFGFLKILTKIWPSLTKFWPKIWSKLTKMVTWDPFSMSVARIQNFIEKCCFVGKLWTKFSFRPSRPI